MSVYCVYRRRPRSPPWPRTSLKHFSLFPFLSSLSLSLSPSALFFRCRPLSSSPPPPPAHLQSFQPEISFLGGGGERASAGRHRERREIQKGCSYHIYGTDDSLRCSRGRNGGRTDGRRLGVDAAVSVAICRREGFWCCCCRCCRRRCSSWRRREKGPDAKKRGRKTERSPTILNRIRELQLSKLFVICYIGKLGIYLSSTIKVLLEVLLKSAASKNTSAHKKKRNERLVRKNKTRTSHF